MRTDKNDSSLSTHKTGSTLEERRDLAPGAMQDTTRSSTETAQERSWRDCPVECGKMVSYRLHDGPNQGQIRPALVVKAFPAEESANLVVFLDGTNDTSHDLPVMWRTGIRHGTRDGQWSWPDQRETQEPARDAVTQAKETLNEARARDRSARDRATHAEKHNP